MRDKKRKLEEVKSSDTLGGVGEGKPKDRDEDKRREV